MAEELVFKIRDRQVLQTLADDLQTVHAEMVSINPNMHLIQQHTKNRWQHQVALTLEFLQKLLPTPVENEDSDV